MYNKTINNIKNLGFFKSTSGVIEEGTSDQNKVINITVEEKATGEISLGAGTGTSGATVAFGIMENNFLGKGINLDANASVTEETIKGKFVVENPNYKNSDKSINVGIEAIEIDRSTEFGYKTNKQVSFGTDFELLQDFSLGLGLTNFYEKITTDVNASALQKLSKVIIDTFLKLDFDYDKRNQNFKHPRGIGVFTLWTYQLLVILVL